MTAPHNPNPDGRAFTLVELMVVLTVLAIVSALVIPRLGSADSSKLVWAAQTLTADLQLMQSEAMAHPDQTRVVEFSLSDGLGYELATVRNSLTKADDELLWNPITNAPYRVTFGADGYEHLGGVYLGKSNLGPDGHLEFGRYGQVEQFSVDPTWVLVAGENSLLMSVSFDTGEVTVGTDYRDVDQIDTYTISGDSTMVVKPTSTP